MEGGRLRPDGVRVAWRLARLNAAGTERLPFVIEDITGRELRVPQGDNVVHRNGVTGIAGFTVAVSALAAAEPLYQGLLGEPQAQRDTPRFRVGDQFIDLVQPGPDNPDVTEFVSRRGSGPFQVTLREASPGAGAPQKFDPALTHTARFVIA